MHMSGDPADSPNARPPSTADIDSDDASGVVAVAEGLPGARDAAADDAAAGSTESSPITPLLVPRDGDVRPVVDPARLAEWARRLGQGSGPVALDAERASGYRYGSRAYLVQLRRADVGTALFDPIALGDLAILDAPLAGSEWVLHAANQDLPCLAEIGMRPRTLFDTELAGRLAGLPRVGLGPLVEQMLGLGLAKGHGAADWSNRPLPPAWLTYAALDVEVLIELRDAMEELLDSQGKLDWARQEFAAIVAAPPTPPRVDPWRRTSGIHKLRDPRVLSIVRELWLARDNIARRRDLAPHRVLPDTAIVAAASARPATADALVALPVFAGRIQRRQSATWWDAIRRAMALPAADLPPTTLPGDGPPPPAKWAVKDPKAAARLAAARAALAVISARVETPVENLISPDLVRRTMWSPPDGPDLREWLRAGGARPWQIDLTADDLRGALDAGIPQVTGQ
ncbi:ribonuclease D [Nakamurella sp. UYEF19]|uniref:ribonuclease D n=1 Tax=Nakamurella sp. UYEF19 TaxID=1756392 RepID=UPI00339130BC